MSVHKTYHAAEPTRDGRVAVGCDTCGWVEWVNVVGLPWAEAMRRIYEARDNHERVE